MGGVGRSRSGAGQRGHRTSIGDAGISDSGGLVELMQGVEPRRQDGPDRIRHFCAAEREPGNVLMHRLRWRVCHTNGHVAARPNKMVNRRASGASVYHMPAAGYDAPANHCRPGRKNDPACIPSFPHPGFPAVLPVWRKKTRAPGVMEPILMMAPCLRPRILR